MAVRKKEIHNKIYLDRWMAFHPYKKPGSSDYYYLDLSNRLYKTIKTRPELGLFSEIHTDDSENLCCYLTCYLEDVVSEIGMMRAFTKQHRELYGKDLPFYSPAEYDYNDINREDIYFLLWHYFSVILYEDTIVSPVSADLIQLGNIVFEVLYEEFERVPENTRLKEFLHLSPGEENFFVVRDKIQFIILDSYLFFFNRLECMAGVGEILDAMKDKMDDNELAQKIPLVTYDTVDNYLLSKVFPLLARRGKDWLAYVLGMDHPLFEKIISITEKKTGSYLFLEQENGILRFEHIASGTILPVTVRSYDTLPDFIEGRTIINCSLIMWKDIWWFSGASAVHPNDPERIKKEKGPEGDKNLFGGLDKKQHDILQEQSQLFLEFNKGRSMAFFNTMDQAAEFAMNFMELFKASIQGSAGADNVAIPHEMSISQEARKEPGFVFFNPKTGMEMVYGYNELIPDPDNPLYNEKKGREDALELLISQEISRECSLYLAEKIGFGVLASPVQYQDGILEENLDFLLRYWKAGRYYSTPSITLI
ncbi:hypothetical protein LCGC14_2117190 [marine sediment metagenome]|uniref:DUF3843 family protein n=1 Tax=marine sediment metagenome TaxID=412755 RepID=A0A0F9E5B8_9ZZZZ|nr:DUF3843 family protein [Bacteroides sp.]